MSSTATGAKSNVKKPPRTHTNKHTSQVPARPLPFTFSKQANHNAKMPSSDEQKGLCIEVLIHKPEVGTKLGVVMESCAQGTYPVVRRVLEHSVAYGKLQAGDVLLAFGGITGMIGAAALTELLRLSAGKLKLTVERPIMSLEAPGDLMRINVNDMQPAFASEGLVSPDRVADLVPYAPVTKSQGASGHHALSDQGSAVQAHQRYHAEKMAAMARAAANARHDAEMRMSVLFAEQMKEALQHVNATSQRSREEAVAAAVKRTEQRCAEEKRIAVHIAVSNLRRQLGHLEDSAGEEEAALDFQSVAEFTCAALAAAMQLQNEQGERDQQQAVATKLNYLNVDAANCEAGGTGGQWSSNESFAL